LAFSMKIVALPASSACLSWAIVTPAATSDSEVAVNEPAIASAALFLARTFASPCRPVPHSALIVFPLTVPSPYLADDGGRGQRAQESGYVRRSGSQPAAGWPVARRRARHVGRGRAALVQG
jgi:hypothetical protein